MYCLCSLALTTARPPCSKVNTANVASRSVSRDIRSKRIFSSLGPMSSLIPTLLFFFSHALELRPYRHQLCNLILMLILTLIYDFFSLYFNNALQYNLKLPLITNLTSTARSHSFPLAHIPLRTPCSASKKPPLDTQQACPSNSATYVDTSPLSFHAQSKASIW
jgi:hypothetical protein